jgi:type II secretory pathway pseudopilin PulG
MKLRRPFSASRQRPVTATGRAAPQSAFTMVEIALCLAIIGFALVAIIGVLPIGMRVQRENREETIINQDASVLMDAIRHGERGLDDLTNYVFAISNYSQWYSVAQPSAPPMPAKTATMGYTFLTSTSNGVAMIPPMPINSGARIIGLLSTPKYLTLKPPPDGLFISNHVVAYVRAISGSAAEKPPQRDPGVQAVAFSYRLTSEIVPVQTPDTASRYGRNLTNNLRELRLTFAWPLLPNGNVGSGRQVFRTMVGGQVATNNDAGQTLYFFQPSVYLRAAQ